MKAYKVQGHTVGFTRRTYGSFNQTIYTWLHVLIDGEWQEIGDPFPKRHYPAKEVVKTIEAHFARKE